MIRLNLKKDTIAGKKLESCWVVDSPDIKEGAIGFGKTPAEALHDYAELIKLLIEIGELDVTEEEAGE